MGVKELCVLSLPRQGTDFLMKCVRDQGNYQREWFNPCPHCNGKFAEILLPYFGSESQKEGLFAIPPKEHFERVLEIWRRSKLNMAKEVWSFAKSQMFVQSIPTIYLFRKRRHTFPSSRPDFFMAIWDSLESSSCNSGLVGEIKSYVASRRISDPREKQVVIHSACWALQFCSAPSQVLQYDKLMDLSRDELVEYLSQRLPSWVDASKVATNIENKRVWNKKEREAAYEKFISGSNAEKEAQMILSFVRSLGMSLTEDIC